MSNNCPRCQKETRTEDMFCGACGYDLREVAPAPVAGTQLDIKVTDVQLSLAMVYFKNGKFAECIELLRKVLIQDADNLNAHTLMDRAKQGQRDASETKTQPAYNRE